MNLERTETAKRATNLKRTTGKERATIMERTNDKKQSWQEKVLDIIRSYQPGHAYTSDSLRKDAVVFGAGLPAHPNMCGAAVRRAGELFLARKTGRYIPSTVQASRGRMVAEWVRI